jgi:hypothetical protein
MILHTGSDMDMVPALHSVQYIQLIKPLNGTTANPENRRDGDIVCRTAPTCPDYAYSFTVKTPKPVLFSSKSGVPLNL